MNKSIEHEWVDCTNCWYNDLAVCKKCGLMEGALTTHCPNENSVEKSNRIYKDGDLDFRNGEWANEPNPTYQLWNIEETRR